MPDSDQPVICWFRNDLRIADNPALTEACSKGQPIIAVFVLEDGVDGLRPLGRASQWWLDKSIRRLADALSGLGLSLTLKRGDPRTVIANLCDEQNVSAVFWNRRYTAGEREIDSEIKSMLKSRGIDVQSFNGSLLIEPWKMQTTSGGPYRVFTPFWKSLRDKFAPTCEGRPPIDGDGLTLDGDELTDWKLHPTNPDWSTGFEPVWCPGEDGAHAQLENFLENDLKGYGQNRDRPDLSGTSKLSPHLRFGEISPHRIWQQAMAVQESRNDLSEDVDKFLSELAWRDFSHNLVYHFEDFATANYNEDFDHFPWEDNPSVLKAWQSGKTGYPIVDAGMRQLWQTGWMHNRVRMITASFLTKHLLHHWKNGEDWFWDTLVDADTANNPAGWQWTAGSGADAAPFFRIFNPITQGEKFDPDGDYVRKWIPELKALPTKYLHSPWTADEKTLEDANVPLGDAYPKPMVDHKDARERALSAYEIMKTKRDGQ